MIQVKESIPLAERLEKGIPHDERSEEVYQFLEAYDFRFGNDFFEFKAGGDGDNGEHLLYLLDEFFANKDVK